MDARNRVKHGKGALSVEVESLYRAFIYERHHDAGSKLLRECQDVGRFSMNTLLRQYLTELERCLKGALPEFRLLDQELHENQATLPVNACPCNLKVGLQIRAI